MAEIAPDIAAASDTLMADLLFVDPVGGAPMLHLARPSEPDPDRTLGAFATVRIKVANGRRPGRATTLEEDGFLFVRHATQVADFYDDAHVRAVYYPEMEALAKRLTGADWVCNLGHTVRGRQTGMRGTVDVEQPSELMHCDFTERSALEMLDMVVSPGEAARLKQRRLMQINLWRPIRGPLRDKPLALCHANSIPPESALPTPFVRPDFTSEFYTLIHDPRQRWTCFPDMAADEVIVFKNYDSGPAMCRFAAHGAIVDPPPPGARPRESIELRLFVAI